MAPRGCNGASPPDGQRSAYLPLWPASEELKRLYGICGELASAWEASGVEDAQRLADTEAVAAAAVAEAAKRLEDLKGRVADLQARCGPLLAEAEAGVSAVGEDAGQLASQVAEAAKAPVRERAAALEALLPELRQRARAQHAEHLKLLGRAPEAEAEGDLAALGRELPRLREAVQERRAAAARARSSLQALWRELAVQPSAEQDPEDAAVRAGGEAFGVSDAEHEVLTRRLAFWESQRSQRQQQQVLDRHGRIRELALAVTPQGDLSGLSGFLEAHSQSSDATALQAKERELEAAAEAQVQSLEQRRRVATAALRRPAVEEAAQRGGDVLHRLRALRAEVEQFDGELNARRSGALEAARRASALWDELGESPEEPRDAEVSRILAAGADAAGIDVQDVAMVAEAAEASCKAWEARKAAAEQELSQLRADLEGLGVPDSVRPLLAQHGTLRREDRAACRSKLQELRGAALRAEEEPKKERLRHLYDLCGIGSGQLEALVLALEFQADPAQRRAKLAQDLEAAERYAKSVRSIVEPIKELRAEVPAGMKFATALKEPALEKALLRKGADFKSRLLEDIGRWEAESGKPFLYDGANVKEWLLAIGAEAEEEEDDSDSSTSEAEAETKTSAPAEAPPKPAMPAELEAAAAKAMAALQAKLEAMRSMPPPFSVDASGGGREKSKEREKEDKKKKKDKDKKEKGDKRKKKADRSKSRKRKASCSSSESGKSHKKKRSRSRKKGRKEHKGSGGKKRNRSPSVSESESGSASSESQPKKKKAHSRRHSHRSKSKSRRRGR